MTRPVSEMASGAGQMLEAFGQMIERHVPGFRDTVSDRKPSHRLQAAMEQAQQRLQAQSGYTTSDAPTPEMLMQSLRERHAALKQAASTPNEKAVVELVAMLFQAILTEERLPAGVRVWFARLQMPTLRVALAEPDFFSTEAHPARRLLDRMGACVMGFEGKGGQAVDPALQAEIKRVVQTIEAFPDTGRRVFQTVLNEFEKFIEAFFREHSEAARQGVSLAQQIEQRETLAIQFTIELRKMLADLPMDEAIRTFLYKIWADVLATAAVRHGGQSEDVVRMREAAGELIWAASAKTDLQEREQMVRRVPSLIGLLREGMRSAGVAAERQDSEMAAVRVPMVAAFSAKSQALSDAQMRMLQTRLASIEEVVADESIELGDEWMLSEALEDQPGIELVAEGGSMPSPRMVERAAKLRSGDLFVVDYRGLRTPMRLAWTGRHRQLMLFVAESGRCLLFPKVRLEAFLQAGLIVAAHEETLTVVATRAAMRQIQANPAVLAG